MAVGSEYRAHGPRPRLHRHWVLQGGLGEAPQPAGLPPPHNVLSVRSRVSLHLPGQALPAVRTPRPPGPQALGSDSSPFDMRSRPGQPAASVRVSVLKLTPEDSNNTLSPAPPLYQAPLHTQPHQPHHQYRHRPQPAFQVSTQMEVT